MLAWDLAHPGLFALAAGESDCAFYIERLKKGPVARYSGSEKCFSQVMQELMGGDLFSSSPLVLISHAESFSEKELLQLTKVAKGFDSQSGVHALFCFSSLQKAKVRTLFEAIETRHSFLSEKPWERTSRLRHELITTLKERGYAMASEALERFEALGFEPLERLTEIDKLIAYAAQRKVLTAEDIDAVCSGAAAASAWKLFDFWIEKKSDSLAQLICASASDTSSLLGLIFPLRHQIAQSAALLENRTDYLKKKYPYLAGARLKGAQNKLRGISQSQLKHLFRQLIDFEILVKKNIAPIGQLRSLLALLLRGEAWAS